MRLLPALLVLASAALTSSSVAAAPESTKTAPMSFKECLTIIAEVMQETGATPATLANTGDLRAVRINADDGFVTIACNRAEGTMAISKSTHSAAIPTVTAAR